ncbi:MAG TPA: phosphatidate cytidylyltransferase [Saprospiraceae bacterium]|nr:phosphatidate cytidylyltransferase [Saprospiraceae bacterium]
MSTKFKTLGQRVSTAIIFGIIMIAGIYISPLSLLGLFGVILFLDLKEYFRVAFTNDHNAQKTYAVWGPVLCFLPYLFVIADKGFHCYHFPNGYVYQLIFALPVFIGLLIELLKKGMQVFSRIGILALGLAYLTIPVSLVAALAVQENSFHPHIVMGLLILTWVNDSGAYFMGSIYGKHKLYPAISPGKTWEGIIGGIISTLLLAWSFSYFFGEFTAIEWTVLGIIVMIFATLGDLTESMLKRNFGVKDSGTLMPGHGGILDRFDAYLFLIPFAYIYIAFISGWLF